MLSLVRGGPKVLIMETVDTSGRVEEFLRGIGKLAEMSPDEAMDLAGERMTLVILCVSHEEKGGIWVLSSASPPENILCDMVNNRLAELLEHVYAAPGMVVMRLLGDMEKGINRIEADFGAVRQKQKWSFRFTNPGNTVIYFTQRPINRNVVPDEFHSDVLIVPKPYASVLAELRSKAGEYLSMSMGTPDWNELDIRIYDADGNYNLHYKRLMEVIDGMELGIVLEETWGRDQAMVLMSVMVYKVRLFSPLPPDDIKRAAMALEYTAIGRRCVDMDVFHGGKKVHWYDEKDKERRDRNSHAELCMQFRSWMLENVDDECRESLLRMEDEIIAHQKEH